ncbi:MAG: hypothetical protein PHO08_04965 [Methylococcales bacterium]|nr:hypothetical protein [Methylococcales bacterium]
MNKNPAQFGYIHSWKSPNHSIKQKMTSLIGVPGRLLKPTRFKMVFLPISRHKPAKTLSINAPFAFRIPAVNDGCST